MKIDLIVEAAEESLRYPTSDIEWERRVSLAARATLANIDPKKFPSPKRTDIRKLRIVREGVFE